MSYMLIFMVVGGNPPGASLAKLPWKQRGCTSAELGRIRPVGSVSTGVMNV